MCLSCVKKLGILHIAYRIVCIIDIEKDVYTVRSAKMQEGIVQLIELGHVVFESMIEKDHNPWLMDYEIAQQKQIERMQWANYMVANEMATIECKIMCDKT